MQHVLSLILYFNMNIWSKQRLLWCLRRLTTHFSGLVIACGRNELVVNSYFFVLGNFFRVGPRQDVGMGTVVKLPWMSSFVKTNELLQWRLSHPCGVFTTSTSSPSTWRTRVGKSLPVYSCCVIIATYQRRRKCEALQWLVRMESSPRPISEYGHGRFAFSDLMLGLRILRGDPHRSPEEWRR